MAPSFAGRTAQAACRVTAGRCTQEQVAQWRGPLKSAPTFMGATYTILKSAFWITPCRMFCPTSRSTLSMAMLVLPAPARNLKVRVPCSLCALGCNGSALHLPPPWHAYWRWLPHAQASHAIGTCRPRTCGRAHQHVFIAGHCRLKDAALNAVQRLVALECKLQAKHGGEGVRARGGVKGCRGRGERQSATYTPPKPSTPRPATQRLQAHLHPILQVCNLDKLVRARGRRAGGRRHQDLLVPLVRPAR